MAIKYVESTARTNKLRCSDCEDKIAKNEEVIFELDDCERKPMQNVYCEDCKHHYEDRVYDDHPFSEEAICG